MVSRFFPRCSGYHELKEISLFIKFGLIHANFKPICSPKFQTRLGIQSVGIRLFEVKRRKSSRECVVFLHRSIVFKYIYERQFCPLSRIFEGLLHSPHQVLKTAYIQNSDLPYSTKTSLCFLKEKQSFFNCILFEYEFTVRKVHRLLYVKNIVGSFIPFTGSLEKPLFRTFNFIKFKVICSCFSCKGNYNACQN